MEEFLKKKIKYGRIFKEKNINYNFTSNWFDWNESRKTDLIDILPHKKNDEIHILEIGSYEGRSTVWFVENFLNNDKSTMTCIDPWEDYSQDANSMGSYGSSDASWKFKTRKIKDVFLNNIELTGKKNQVLVKQGMSNKILPLLISEDKEYDVVYIDGNHVAPFVLMDAVMSWNLLKKNGIMIFDDYLWGPDIAKTLRPQIAIDNFIEVFKDYCREVKLNNYKAIVKKI